MENHIQEMSLTGALSYVKPNSELIPVEYFKENAKLIKGSMNGRKDPYHSITKFELEKTYELLGEDYFFKKIKVEVDGEFFILGFQALSDEMINKIGNFLINRGKDDLTIRMQEDFIQRLPHENSEERKILINAEIEYWTKLINQGEGSEDPEKFGLYSGFISEQRLLNEYEFKRPFSYGSYKKTLQGAALHQYLHFLKSVNEDNDTSGNSSNEPIDISDIPFTEQAAHRLILLEQLGIIQAITNKAPHLAANKGELGKLIAVILNIKEERKIGTLTRNLSYLENDPDGKLKTAKSLNAVNAILARFGIKSPKN